MSIARCLIKKPSVTRAALIALTAGLSLGASVAQAQVVDSGLLATPISVPNTTAGVYLNVLTGATGATGTGLPGWDFNPWGSLTAPAGLALFWPAPATSGGVSTAGVYDNMAVGATVGPASTFIQTTTPASAANLRLGGTVYVGMRFLNETGSTLHYGFVQMTTTAPTGFPAQIVRYVFNATPNTAVTITAPGGGGTTPPQFGFTPAAGSTVAATGGTTVGSTGNLSIAVAVATAGSGTGTAATTTTTCTAPTAPFAGFGQTVTAVGTGAITGGPLAGTCTLGAAAATQTLTCVENRGGTPTTRTWTLNCPAGTAPPVATVPVNATSTWSLIALMLALFGFAAVAVRRQG